MKSRDASHRSHLVLQALLLLLFPQLMQLAALVCELALFLAKLRLQRLRVCDALLQPELCARSNRHLSLDSELCLGRCLQLLLQLDRSLFCLKPVPATNERQFLVSPNKAC